MTVSRLRTWVTLALNDEQAVQALVLARSLRRVATTWRLVVLTNKSISNSTGAALTAVFDGVIVPDWDGKGNPIPEEQYYKLYCWNLYLVERCIFVHPGTLVVKNCDDLMKRKGFWAALDDKKEIDSSLFICEPSLKAFQAMVKIYSTNGTSDGLSKVFKRHWGKDLNVLEEGLLLNDASDKFSLLEKARIPLIKLGEMTPHHMIKIKDQCHSGDFSKNTLKHWWEIFSVDVEPLLKGNEISKTIQNSNVEIDLEPIAIVGMGCRLPGANNLADFWKLLIGGGDAIRSPPDHRLPPGANPDVAKSMKAGFLNCPIDEFDGKFFGISPLEISFLDPQTRILLEVLWEAMEDAAIDPTTIKGTNAGIFTGAWTQDYKELINRTSIPTKDFFRKYMGNAMGACAGRLAFILGVTGPNIATESGCSSSMVAMDLACKSLRLGETQLALACGVNLVLHQFMGNDMDAICAKDGHCKTFDASADGFGRAEGCGVLILKKYSHAIRDGDKIHGLIRGMGAAQEGISRSLGTPTVECESAAMKMALRNAGVEPWEVSYVESHGTGTPVGDPMEMAAIAEAYSRGRKEPLIVGSVKTNVGHTESCSGITGVIKTILSLKHEIIPTHRNFESLNPNVNLEAVPAILPLQAIPWPRQEGKIRYAGVSSFGITGTDAHAIIQEAPLIQSKSSVDLGLVRPQHVLTISAKSEFALEELLIKYKEQMESEIYPLGDVGFTANTGRSHFNYRAAIVGKSSAEIAKNITKKAFVQGKVAEEQRKVCFLFTGQGSQYVGMGKTLYETSPEFRFHFDHCESVLRKKFDVSILPVLWADNEEQRSQLSRTIHSQTSIFCIEYCLLKLWESWGVKPDCVLGHSLGEFGAAAAAGILRLEDALTLVAERSRLIDNLPRGQMVVVKEDKNSVDTLLQQFQGNDKSLWLDYAAVNSNEQTVLAGDSSTVQKFVQFCNNNNIKSIILEATHAFHSRHMNPMLKEYGQVASKIQYQTPTCNFISGMDGKLMEAGTVNADYWVRHTRESVDYKQACKVAYNEGCRTFLEIGPQPVLSALTMANSSYFETQESISCLPSLRKNADEWSTILTSLAKLHVSGLSINWKDFDQFYGRTKVSLPTYPFQRKKFWFDTNNSNSGTMLMGAKIHPLIGCIISNPTPTSIYQGFLELSNIPYVKDHMIGETVIVPGAGFLEMSMAAGFATTQGMKNKFEFPMNPISFENLMIETPLQISEDMGCQVQVIVAPNESSSSKVSVYRELILEDGTQKWIRHATGNYSPFAVDYEADKKMITDDLSSIRARIPEERDLVKFYSDLSDVKLNFGPIFKSMKKAWKNSEIGEVLAEIPVPVDSGEYLCHPVIIDAMIQAFMANKLEVSDQLEVPVRIGKFIWFNQIDTETVYAHSFSTTGSKIPSTCVLYNSNGSLLALMAGIELVPTSIESILSVLKNQNVTLPPIFEDVWKSRSGPLENRFKMGDGGIYSEGYVELAERLDIECELDLQFFPKLNSLCYYYIQKAFYTLGWKPTLGEVLNAQEFCERFSILKPLEKFVNRLLMIIGEEGYLSGVQNSNGTFISWTVTSILPSEQICSEKITEIKKILNTGTPQVFGATDIVVLCAENLADVLIGKVSPVNLLFTTENEDGENRAESFYRLSTLSKYLKQGSAVRDLLQTCKDMPDGSKGVLQILEVGAGTGSLTKIMLPILEELKLPYHYTYTDISAGFFPRAQKMFESYAKNMTYKVFDLEKDPIEQGFAPQQFDFIVNVNVLHICKQLSQCMKNLRQLTCEFGLVFIAETTVAYREIDLVFGLFEGYWGFEDYELRANHCVMSGDSWEGLLQANGYESTRNIKSHQGRGGIIVGRAGKTAPLYSNKQLTGLSKTWILFKGTDRASDYLSRKLNSSGRDVFLIGKASKYGKTSDFSYQINPMEKADLEAAVSDIIKQRPSIEGVIYMFGDDDHETDQRQICEPFLYLSQIIVAGVFKPLPKVFFVTRGNCQVGDQVVSNPSVATLGGVARTLRSEVNHLYCKGIDMDPMDLSDTALEETFMEMWKNDLEIQISYRQRKRNFTRIVKFKDNLSALMIPNSDGICLALPASKAINDLRIIPLTKAPLSDYDIEVENKSIALNFKDIFAVLKPIAEFDRFDTIGADYAGIVTSVGSKVTDKKIGDRVFGCNFAGGAAPSHNVLPSEATEIIPDGWTFSEAATMPVVFGTAYYCMVTVADLKRNETILIHAGSGGVGLVAIQLAKYIGANIITTAGNERKRAYLRNLGIKHVFHSRNTDYEQQIKEATGGKGVNMVLNCLTGPGFKEASLDICAPGASFVEMSKLEVWSPEEVATRRPDVKYTIADLTTVDTDVWKMLFSKMTELMNLKVIRPIPSTSFDIVHVREALNYLQKAKHIGKVLVQMPKRVKINGELNIKFNMFNEDSTYLITGGLGGIGLEVAAWMCGSGAKHVVLVGRNVPNAAAAKKIESLTNDGKHIVALQADVGYLDQCKNLLATLKDPSLNLPPLRGIMHAAGTLSDALFADQSWSKFTSTYHPKVNGGLNLHNLTKDYSLEHFVMYSSIVALLGNMGQANHASGNAFLDALANHRHSIGLPGLSVNWGQWGEVGVAAEIKINGIKAFSPKQGVMALEAIMKSNKIQACPFDGDFNLFRKLYPRIIPYMEEVKSNIAGPIVTYKAVDSKAFRLEFDEAENDVKQLDVCKSYIEIIIRQILKLDTEDEIDANQNLGEVGLDSLMLVELKNSIQALIGTDALLNVKEMADCQTVMALSQYVQKVLQPV